MKRLLCIVSSLDTGGAETFMMKVFRSMPSNYKLDFIVSTKDGFYEKEVISLGGKIYRVPLRTKHPFKTFIKINKIVKNNKYNYILKLCDTPIGYFDLFAAKIGGSNRICVRSCNSSSSESKIKRVINNLLRPMFNNIIDVKIAPSILAAEYTFGKKQVENGNVNFLHNAVDLQVYKYTEEGRNKIRKEFNLESEQLVIGHIGRFNYQKNHMFLLSIFAEIQKENKNSVLMLVGTGEKKDELIYNIEKLGLRKSVIFTGVRSDIPDLLSAMDIFVFPSYFEGMPNTIIEAQATGLPCILSDTITKEAKITEIIKYLSLEETAQVWAKEALKLSKLKRKNMKEEFEKAHYDIQSTVSEFIKLIF
ncbi:glycosyltransferase family 1 protein [Clostridium cadaveris]|uniref:glycosyltransferase family 1 protein n=1 Tax=Clostridium cadaveris TaxID=1529 RepID=UPI003994EE0E